MPNRSTVCGLEGNPSDTSGSQQLPSTATPLAWYALLGGLSLAGAYGLHKARR